MELSSNKHSTSLQIYFLGSTNFKPIVLNEANFLRNCLLFRRYPGIFYFTFLDQGLPLKNGQPRKQFCDFWATFHFNRIVTYGPLFINLLFYLSVSRP